MGILLVVAFASIIFYIAGLNAQSADDYKLLDDSFAAAYANDANNDELSLKQHAKSPVWKRQNVPVGVAYPSPVRRFYQPRPGPYVARKLPGYMPIPRGNILLRRPNVRYARVQFAPVRYAPFVQRSRTPFYNAYKGYRPRPGLYNRGWTVSGKQLNANTGTNSHTVSNSVLKAPGHTTTNTHVVNKQQTGGGVRGMNLGQVRMGIAPYRVFPYRYPNIRMNNLYARAKVSASARVNAKAASSTSSASNSHSSSSSPTNGGSRTTSGSGGWGYGAGAGYGTGPGAWGIGYGGGAGGSAGSIPSGMTGIPGMSSGYPSIPHGFPGMPAGGFPGQKTKYAGSQGIKARKPSSTKAKQTALKLKKGIDSTLKAAKAFKIRQAKYNKPRYQLRPLRINQAINRNRKINQLRKNFVQRTIVPQQSYKRYPMNRVLYYTFDTNKRPTNFQWQNFRQRIMPNFIRG